MYDSLVVSAVLLSGTTVRPDGGSSSSGSFAAVTDEYIGEIVSHMDEVKTVCAQIWILLTGNPYFAFCLCAGLLSVGVYIFRRVRQTARH